MRHRQAFFVKADGTISVGTHSEGFTTSGGSSPPHIQTPAEIFGADLLSDWDAAFVILDGSSQVTNVINQVAGSAQGDLTSPATPPDYDLTGGINGTPIILIDRGQTQFMSSQGAVPGPITTTLLVLENADPGAGDIYSVGSATSLTVRYSGVNSTLAGLTVSDEATYNNQSTPLYTFDNAVHYLGTTVEQGTVCPYYLDGTTLVQCGFNDPSAPPTAQPVWNAGPIALGQGGFGISNYYLHRFLVINGTPTLTQFTQLYTYLDSQYR